MVTDNNNDKSVIILFMVFIFTNFQSQASLFDFKLPAARPVYCRKAFCLLPVLHPLWFSSGAYYKWLSGVIIVKGGRAVSCLRHSHGDGVRSIDFRGSAPTVPFLFPAPPQRQSQTCAGRCLMKLMVSKLSREPNLRRTATGR